MMTFVPYGIGSQPDLSLEPAGTIARTIPRHLVSSATIAAVNTTGVVGCSGIDLLAGQLITNVAVLTGSTPANLPTHFWMGLADANLKVLAVTADQLTAAIPNATWTQVPLLAQFRIPASGEYYVLVSTTATTAPTLTGATLAAGNAAQAPVLCGTGGTQSLPPAVGATLGGGTVNANGAQNFAAWLL